MLPSSQPLARIDLSALSHNLAEVRRLVGSSTAVMPMVKADAYGHGVAEVCSRLAADGCDRFGVVTIDEAAEVRHAVPDARVVVLGGILVGDAERVVELGAEVSVYSSDVVDALGAAARAAGKPVAVHIDVDTGMCRLGLEPQAVADFVGRVVATEGVELVALFSHLAIGEDGEEGFTGEQLRRLLRSVNAIEARKLEGPCGPLTRDTLTLHAANSSGILTSPSAHLDVVRPGLMLYGLCPDERLSEVADLRPVMQLDAPILRIATVGFGEGVGYGHSYRTSGTARIATLRCGYADGYPRSLSNRGFAVVRGRRAPVVGRVCMDHTMIDVTEIDDAVAGDRAVLWGADPPAAEVAELADTISYELVSRVGRRVPRVYTAGTGGGS